MDYAIFEDSVKYDTWVKVLLALPILLLLGLAALFYYDAVEGDLLEGVPPEEAKLAAVILLISAAFVVLVYRAVLPRNVAVLRDRIRIKLGWFSWNIKYSSIASVKAVSGWGFSSASGSVTSWNSQIEIVRKRGQRVRLSPVRRDMFLTQLNRALSDWKQMHSRETSSRSS